ncbi:unnamed protein product, partial [Didymodactylos carnosus]
MTLIMQLFLYLSAYHAGKKLHWSMLNSVLHAPISFFDTTPLGQILNRFAKDIDSVDSALPTSFASSLNTMISVIATVIILIYGSYFASIALLPLAVLFIFIQIGIIGRTSSGKSSLCITLLRIIERTQGKIIIDNIDITDIGLHDVRSKITIIPQDAVIFAGTLRFNMGKLDEEIWNVLELAHLKRRTFTVENGLHYQLTEGGENLSAGEKQL